MISRITLLGSSSGRNAGDAALISGIMDSIDEEARQRILYEIPTIKPQFIYDNYQNRVRPISMLPWAGSLKMLGIPTLSSILRTDMSLIFDAILFDRQLYNPLFNFLSTLSLMLPLAKKRGKMLGCFNVGAGPVTTPRGQAMLRDVCNLMDFITVRDDDSLRILREIGVSHDRILVTADAALAVRAAPAERVDQILKTCGLSGAGNILGLNISAYLDSWVSPNRTSMGKDRFIEIYSAAISRVLSEIRVPALFVCTQHHDVAVSKELMARIQSPEPVALVSNRELSHYEIKGVLARVSLLFGMRLHAVILAASELTPVAALPHQPKVNHFLKTLDLAERAMSFDGFSVDTLAEHLRRAWEDRHTIRAQLNRSIPVQKSRSRAAARLIAGLHRGEGLPALLAALRAELAQSVVPTSSPAAGVLPPSISTLGGSTVAGNIIGGDRDNGNRDNSVAGNVAGTVSPAATASRPAITSPIDAILGK